jgi:hypothetical protein
MQVINRPGSGETCLSPRSPPRHADTRKRLTVGLHELKPLIARGRALSRWLSIGALWLFWLDGEKRKPLILLMWVEGLPPLLTSNKCQRDNAFSTSNATSYPPKHTAPSTRRR